MKVRDKHNAYKNLVPVLLFSDCKRWSTEQVKLYLSYMLCRGKNETWSVDTCDNWMISWYRFTETFEVFGNANCQDMWIL